MNEDPDDLLELAFHLRRHVRTSDPEVLEVGRRKHQHLAGAVVPEIIVALLVLRGLRPVEEVLLLALGLLGEEVIGQPYRQEALFVQLLDNGVVFRIILESSAGVDGTGDAQPVQLAHEMTGRIDLIIEGKLRSLGKGRVENVGVRFRQQQARRIAIGVSHDLAARRFRRILRIANRTKGGAVQYGPIIEVQQEDRRVGRDGIEFVDRRQPLLRELVFGESADHPHPLRRRRDGDLPLQHVHRVGQRAHPVPAELHVEVEPAADDVKVIVDQPRQDAAPFQIDDLGRRPGQLHDLAVVADRGEDAILDGDRACGRVGTVERGEEATVEDSIGSVHDAFSATLVVSLASSACRPGSMPNM